MRRLRFTSLLAALALAATAGCSDDPSPGPGPTTDAGNTVDTPTVTDVPVVDAPPEDMGRPMRNPQPIYGPCDSDAECRDGYTCQRAADTGYSGGQCNRECTRDDDCVRVSTTGAKPIDGFCLAADASGHRYCGRVCANGIDCGRDGWTCTTLNSGALNQVNVCISICTPTSCIDGTVCEPESGRCRPASSPAPTGRTVGQACVPAEQTGSTAENRCVSSLCSPEVTYDSMMNPFYTGNVGGFCYGRCILPSGYNSSSFWPMPELPQAGCSDGAVCIPNRSLAEGDIGLCFAGCRANSDCRQSEGYVCRLSVTLGTRTVRFQRGWCEPGDCVNTAGFTCPSGTVCRRGRTSSGATVGDCVPASTVDAGVSDAGAGDAGSGSTDAGDTDASAGDAGA